MFQAAIHRPKEFTLQDWEGFSASLSLPFWSDICSVNVWVCWLGEGPSRKENMT